MNQRTTVSRKPYNLKPSKRARRKSKPRSKRIKREPKFIILKGITPPEEMTGPHKALQDSQVMATHMHPNTIKVSLRHIVMPLRTT